MTRFDEPGWNAEFLQVWVATNPPCFAFVNFRHRSDADQAIREGDGK